jgi:hypothetical protein
MWDSLIPVLAASEASKVLATLVVNLHKESTCPTEDVKRIQEGISWIKWIGDYLVDESQTEGMSLRDVVQLLQHIKQWDTIDI